MRIRPAAITLALLALVAGLAAAAAMPSSAAAAGKPCWERVIDDWLDNGTIDGHYKAACYQQALKHVPEDLRDYSNITDAISAALSDTLRARHGQRRLGNGTGSRAAAAAPEAATPTTGNGTASRRASPTQSLYRRAIDNLGTTKAELAPDPTARPRRPRRAAARQRRRPRRARSASRRAPGPPA